MQEEELPTEDLPKTPLSLQLFNLIYGVADFAGEQEENLAQVHLSSFTTFCGLEKTLSHSTSESEYTVKSYMKFLIWNHANVR